MDEERKFTVYELGRVHHVQKNGIPTNPGNVREAKMAFIEQDLTTKIGLVGRLQVKRKCAGSKGWEKLWERPHDNKVVDAGLGRIARRLGSETVKAFKYGEIGIGTTSATDTDTACESPILTRVKSTFSTESTAVFEDTGKWVTQFTSDTTSYAVTEYVTAETLSGTPIFNRLTFAAITLNNNDILEFSYTNQVQKA